MTLRRYTLLLLAPLCAGILLGSADQAQAKRKKQKEFLYVHDNPVTPSSIRGFEVAKNGDLTELTNSPFGPGDNGTGCGGDCGTLAYSAADRLLFYAGNGGVTVLQVAKDGSLTPVAGSPFGGFSSLGLATVRKGSRTFVYASVDAGGVAGFAVGPGGTLSAVPGSPFAGGSGSVGVAANSKNVFLSNQSSDTVSVYTIAANGSLAQVAGSPVATGDHFFVKADPTGSFFYVPNDDVPTIRGFRTHPATGAVQALPGQPYAGNVLATAGLALNAGLLAFAIDRSISAPNAQAFIQAANGSLSQLGVPQDLGIYNLDTSALNGTGKFLGVASETTVATFTPNPASGALALVDSDPAAMNRPSGAVFVKL